MAAFQAAEDEHANAAYAAAERAIHAMDLPVSTTNRLIVALSALCRWPVDAPDADPAAWVEQEMEHYDTHRDEYDLAVR